MKWIRMTAAAALLATLGLFPAAFAAETDPVDLGGEPVEGGTSAADPTELTAGVWSDTLAPGETVHHYSYRRTKNFSAVHVGVVGTTAQSDSIYLDGNAGEDTTCGSGTDSSSSNFVNSSFGLQLSFLGSGPEDRNDECLTSDVVNFSVSHSGEDADMPIAITVVEELPTELRSTVDLPSAPETVPPYKAPDVFGSGEDVTGGTSFDEAPVLEDGAWTDTIASGDELLYGVDLDWGQSVSVKVTTPKLSAEDAEKAGIISPTLGVGLIDPLRNSTDDEPEGATNTVSMSDEEEAEATAALGPVRYLDRFNSSKTYVPGRHWLTVRMTGPGDDQPIDVPIKVEVEVQGERTGVPTYNGGEDAFLIGDDEWSATVSPDGGGASTLRLVLAGVLALLGAGCLAVGTLRLGRRRA